MNSKIILAFFCIILLLQSCEKSLFRNSEIRIGDTHRMLIKTYDSINHLDPIDIDNDNVADIIIDICIDMHPGGGVASSSLMCLHNDIQILGEYSNDTIFLHKDTTISEENTIYWIYTNSKLTPYDITESINSIFKIKYFEINNTINIQNTNTSDTITTSFYSSSPDFYIENNITNYFRKIRNKDYTLPTNTIKYIGIKCNENNKLGWLKIKYIDYPTKHIQILESAIQK